MTITLGELSKRFGLLLKGDAACVVHGVGSLASARPGELTFFDSGANQSLLSTTKASAVILHESVTAQHIGNQLIAPHPRLSFAKISAMFAYQPKYPAGVHASAVVGSECSIDESACIGPQVVIGDHVTIGPSVVIAAGCVIGDYVAIGEGSHLAPNVTVNHSVQLGQRVTIFSGAVIGSDGFGYTKEGEAWIKVPQLGTVIVADDVEIGANTVIDRGALDDTLIGRGVILDNLIQIAHNVEIGEYTAVAGCVGIAGSTIIGRHCSIGGGTGIAGHINITDNVMLTGMCMVTNSIKTPGIYSSGTGLQPNKAWHKSVIRFQQIDKLVKRIKGLENTIKTLTAGKK